MTGPAQDRAALLDIARIASEATQGARLIWPHALGGPGLPCTLGPLLNAAHLQPEGQAYFNDAVVTLRVGLLAGRMPAAGQMVRLSPGPDMPWRVMRIDSVTILPGGSLIQLHLNSVSE